MAKFRSTLFLATIAAAVTYAARRRNAAPRFAVRPVFSVRPVHGDVVPRHHHHVREYGLAGLALFALFAILSFVDMRSETAKNLKTQVAHLSVVVLPPGIPNDNCRIDDFFQAYFAQDTRCDLDRNGEIGVEDLSLVLLGEEVLKQKAKNGTIK